MWGAPGTMLAAHAMHERTGDAAWLAAWEASAERLWDAWTDPVWRQDLAGRPARHVGPAHGFAGNVHALHLGDHLAPSRRAELDRRAAEVTTRLAEREGDQWPWHRTVVGPVGRRRAWCQARPGIVASLASSRRRRRVHRLLVAGGELTWTAGPLAKGPGLPRHRRQRLTRCSKLFERTQDERWLARARAFGMHAIAQVETECSAHGRGRYALWTGDPGTAAFLAGCLSGRAELPLLRPLLSAPARPGAGPPAHASSASAAVVAPSCAAAHADDLARPLAQRGPSERPPHRQPQRARARAAAAGSRTPTPAHSARAAFSYMSPGGRADDHRAAARQRAHQRAVAAVDDHEVARAASSRVGQPRHEHRVRRDRVAVEPRRLAAVPGGDHAHVLAGQAVERGAQQRAARRRARSTARPARPARRPAAASPARPAAPTSAGRRRASTPATSRGYSSCGSVPTSVSSARQPAVCSSVRGGSPSCARARVVVVAPRAPGRARTSRSMSATRRAPSGVRGSRAPSRVRREAGRAAAGRRAGRASRPGTSAQLGRQRRRQRQDVRRRRRRARKSRTSGSVSRAAAHRGLVGLQRPPERGEDLVLRRGGERHPGRLDVPLPLDPGLQAHVVPALDQPRAQREHRERVPGVAERAEQDPHQRSELGDLRAAARCGPRASTPRARRSACRRPRRGRRRAGRGPGPPARTAPPRRSARPGAPPSPRPSCPRGRGPAPRGPRRRSRRTATSRL